jgi:hypothetical protein
MKYDYRIEALGSYTAEELGGGGDPEKIADETKVPSLEGAPGSNFVEIITAPKSSNISPAKVENITHQGFASNGDNDDLVDVEIVDPKDVTGHEYEVTFNYNSGDDVYTWSVRDKDEDEYILQDIPNGLSYNSSTPVRDENIVDGVKITVNDRATGYYKAEWKSDIQVDYGPGSTVPILAGSNSGGAAWQTSYGFPGVTERKEYKFVFHPTGDTTTITTLAGEEQTLPTYDLELYDITDPDNSVKIYDTREGDLAEVQPWYFFGVSDPTDPYYGYGLYQPVTEGIYFYDPQKEQAKDGETDYLGIIGDEFPEKFYARCNIGIGVNIGGDIYDSYKVQIAQNPDARKIHPQDGDELIIHTTRAVSETIKTDGNYESGDMFTINTDAETEIEVTENTLEEVKVVPNPYIVGNAWSDVENDDRIRFMHIPNKCRLLIYNVAGDLVRTLDHSSESGYIEWNVRNARDQEVAPGVYVYVIYGPNGEEKSSGTFSVIK